MRQARVDYDMAYMILVVSQLLVCNYLHVSPYLMLSILPVLVLTIPIRVGTVGAMIIAFITGFAVDILAEGLLGINALALVPVAFIRRPLITLLFGNEMFSREEDFSVHKNGFFKVFVAIVSVQALFLVIYIWADGAATRPLWFNALRFGVSLVAGVVISLLLIDTLAPDDKK